MRAGLVYIFAILMSAFWAASPALAARAKAHHRVQTAVIKSSTAVEQHGYGEHCDQPEESEVITAAYHQNSAYAPVMLTVIQRFNAFIYPVVMAPLPGSRDKARIQPYYRLILFPFHGFW